MLKIGMLVDISESSLMMEIITSCATMKDRILGRLMDFEQRGKSSSRYSRNQEAN
jgi:hypothetical protein